MKFIGEIFLSEIYKKHLIAADGSRVGRITDFSVSRGDVFPVIDGFVVAVGTRKFKLAYEEIEVRQDRPGQRPQGQGDRRQALPDRRRRGHPRPDAPPGAETQ
jgi:hypothetical protein